ncbi:MAG: formylglycine-generating enzyme family protein [Pirellulaceae bacterium]
MSKLLPLASLSVVLAVGVMLVGCSNQQEEITNSIGMTLKLVPAGEFMMGSPEDELHRGEDEGPQHRVRITQPFYLGETEVTQGQWEAVMDTQPWQGELYAEEGSDYPANYISWEDAVAFCERLSEKEGRTYRLPTEAEWEYACRAGTDTAYTFGDDPSELGEYAWFKDNVDAVGEEYAHEVGRKRANDFGLYDMHGNVWEWCADWYDSDYYGGSPTEDPSGPTSGSGRVSRGGSWSTDAGHCRSARRSRYSPGYRFITRGFRVALVAAE